VSDYKTTLNLPVTDFPMKANLANREGGFLQQWHKIINLIYQENTPTLTSIFYLSNFGLNSPLHRDFQS